MTKVPVVSDDLAGGGVAGLLWVTAGKIPTLGLWVVAEADSVAACRIPNR
jgi:hypothetical protein